MAKKWLFSPRLLLFAELFAREVGHRLRVPQRATGGNAKKAEKDGRGNAAEDDRGAPAKDIATAAASGGLEATVLRDVPQHCGWGTLQTRTDDMSSMDV